MSQRITLFFALTILFICPLWAQVRVLGSLAIGDTTKFHLLKTTREDRFIGTVLFWSADSLVFLTNAKVRIAFPPSEVRSIEVAENQQAGHIGAEIFVLETTDGKSYFGYVKGMDSNRIIFAAGNAGTIRLWAENVVSIEPTSTMTMVMKEPFVNEYCLKSVKGKKVVGEMMGYSGGQVEFKDERGRVVREPLKNLRKYSLNPQYTPYTAHSRALLFLPTGFGMAKGDREFRNIVVGINNFAYGITDQLSLGAGLVSFLPYVDLKFSQPIGKYVHWSIGGYAFVPFSFGYHSSVSIGTPDYFLNISYLRNRENKGLYTDSDFESFGVGASLRSGRRSRLFAEYNILVAPSGRFGYGLFYETGFGNSFSWGYGWFNRKLRLETGIMATGPFYSYFCTGPDCPSYYHLPIPFFSFGFNF